MAAEVKQGCKVKFLVNFDGTFPSERTFQNLYKGSSCCHHIIPKDLENYRNDDNFDLRLIKKDKDKEQEYLRTSKFKTVTKKAQFSTKRGT